MKKPSVTELLDILNKPALMHWANKIGLQGIALKDYRKRVASEGTSLHNQIERWFYDRTPFDDIVTQLYFDDFIVNKEFVSVEEKIECEYFQGRLDAKMIIDGCKYLIDFKRSNKIYFEQKLQLTAYKMCNPDYKVAIVNIPRFEFKPIDLDFNHYEEILKCLHTIYTLKNKLGE